MMESKILIATSVEKEKEAILRGLNDASMYDVIVVGVGSAKAAASTAIALSKNRYNLVINMGIAGGFRKHIDIGELVIATDIICGDLGSETLDGFLSVEQLGFGTNRFQSEEYLLNKFFEHLQAKNFPVKKGPILTLSTTTGTQETLHKLEKRFPYAVAEAMEGFGVAVSANEFHIPFLEIRAISNFVGPRDRNSWKIEDALNMLQLASSELLEVF